LSVVIMCLSHHPAPGRRQPHSGEGSGAARRVGGQRRVRRVVRRPWSGGRRLSF